MISIYQVINIGVYLSILQDIATLFNYKVPYVQTFSLYALIPFISFFKFKINKNIIFVVSILTVFIFSLKLIPFDFNDKTLKHMFVYINIVFIVLLSRSVNAEDFHESILKSAKYVILLFSVYMILWVFYGKYRNISATNVVPYFLALMLSRSLLFSIYGSIVVFLGKISYSILLVASIASLAMKRWSVLAAFACVIGISLLVAAIHFVPADIAPSRFAYSLLTSVKERGAEAFMAFTTLDFSTPERLLFGQDFGWAISLEPDGNSARGYTHNFYLFAFIYGGLAGLFAACAMIVWRLKNIEGNWHYINCFFIIISNAFTMGIGFNPLLTLILFASSKKRPE